MVSSQKYGRKKQKANVKPKNEENVRSWIALIKSFRFFFDYKSFEYFIKWLINR
ncbi:hypothetical protein CCAND95_840009 [Capnocytophaga canis]|uniref:Uncharacterized protein n=1 Tax=Capnocytophaga canis TaxID=1848903 RepID=A0A0B7IGJ6_9FLAO|nr:hypothetical protein CCAND95_840009 [Capnocytophaga canis]CEN49113.1 hypothetical protein CCAND38_760011 [Capnocytophaga canis]CEN50975.1 hypothetical protein CCAND93_1290010 [Capnocytophaga canis]